MDKIKQLFQLLFWGTYCGFILISFFTSLSSNTQSKLPLRSYIVTSGSMEPTIFTGDLIIINSRREYKKNDIVTFIDSNHRIITHRIVEQTANKFVTKGDNNRTADSETISQENIIGKYQVRLASVGYMLVYSQKPFGIFLLLSTPLLLILAERLFKKQKSHE